MLMETDSSNQSIDKPDCEACLAKVEVSAANVAKSQRALKWFPIVIAIIALALLGGYTLIHCQRSSRNIYIAMSVDKAGIPQCEKHTDSMAIKKPCLNGRDLMLTSDTKPLGPLVCSDHSGRNCEEMFHFTQKRDGVLIPEDGVYRVHSRVTFLDNDTAADLTSTVRIDSRGSVGADGDGGIWLDCASHSAHKEADNPFGFCALDGLRRMQRGDVVSFHVRSLMSLQVNIHSSATLFFIHKL